MSLPHLDHIVLLLPHATLLHPPPWLAQNFTITPGGTHSDQKTTNKLIIFPDGTYLELISFIDDSPARMANHWWNPSQKGHGIIDYAFSMGEGAEAFERELRPGLEALEGIPRGWGLQDLRGGSRVNGEGGERIEWRVAFPQAEVRGRVPFWCFDVTPRELRVTADVKATTHPCGATGVKGLEICAAKIEAAALGKVFGAIMPTGEGASVWQLATPNGKGVCLVSVTEATGKDAEAEAKRRLMATLTLATDREEREIREVVGGDQVVIKLSKEEK